MTPIHPTLAALGHAQDGLATTVAALSAQAAAGPSYCDEWTIAQVLSHLGSGAEVFAAIVSATLAGQPPPGPESFPPIWDRWNAKDPADQVADGLAASGATNQLLVELDADQLALGLDLFGMSLTLADVAAMRLNELALHSWDVAVMADPAATLAADAVAVVIDRVGQLATWTGRPADSPRRFVLTTTGPDRTFALTLGEAVTLGEAEPGGTPEGTVAATLPAEALVRLVAGRLDADHTPGPVGLSAGDLEVLRATFPGP